jgi:hypothetical protein
MSLTYITFEKSGWAWYNIRENRAPCVDNFGNDVHGDVRLRSDGTALLLLFTFYPSKIDESIRVFYTQGQILLESMEQPQ